MFVGSKDQVWAQEKWHLYATNCVVLWDEMADDTIMILPNTQRRVLSAPLRFCFFAKIETLRQEKRCTYSRSVYYYRLVQLTKRETNGQPYSYITNIGWFVSCQELLYISIKRLTSAHKMNESCFLRNWNLNWLLARKSRCLHNILIVLRYF